MVTNEALQKLVQAARDLHQTAKMMRAVGTGGMSPTHPKMMALMSAIDAVEGQMAMADEPAAADPPAMGGINAAFPKPKAKSK